MSQTNKLGALATHSLAEFVYLTAEHRKGMLKEHGSEIIGHGAYAENTRFYESISDALPHTKRISYDSKFKALVEKTDPLETEDIIGQLCHTTFLFDQMWIEGISPFDNHRRIGMLISTNQDTHSIKFRYVTELWDEPHHAYNRTDSRSLQYIQERRILDTRDIETTISPEGISVNEDQLILLMDRASGIYAGLGKPIDSSPLINEVYSVADFLARIFLVLNAREVATDFNPAKTKADLELEGKNRRRMAQGRPPILSTTPIIVDIAKTNPRFFEDLSEKEARELLGTTMVSRSKLITRPDGTLWLRKKDGLPWSRKAHTRKIVTPVDRTDAPRVITASKAGTVEIFPDRPPEIRTGQRVDGSKPT